MGEGPAVEGSGGRGPAKQSLLGDEWDPEGYWGYMQRFALYSRAYEKGCCWWKAEAGGESVMLALNTQKPKWAANPARSMERDSAVMLRGRDGDIGYERQTPAPWGPNESLFLKHH